MYKSFFKRLIDVILSVLALILLSWLYLIIAVIIKATSKGPVLFKQERIGKNGKVFNILKFRSMKVGAEKTGSGVYSGKGDPRVTKVGKFIRATSIDELPQLINILKGDMALIGPRPPLTYHPIIRGSGKSIQTSKGVCLKSVRVLPAGRRRTEESMLSGTNELS